MMVLKGGISEACGQGKHSECPGWVQISGQVYSCICSCGHVRTMIYGVTMQEFADAMSEALKMMKAGFKIGKDV